MLSVVIPTFNRVVQLTQALESLLHQLPKGSEVMVVDDGSSDGTAGRVALLVPLFAGSGVRLECLCLDHTGNVSSVRNFGAKHSAGDYLLFMDSDVQLGTGFIARVVNFLTENPTVGCVGGLVFSDSASSTPYSTGVYFPNRWLRVLYLYRPAAVSSSPYKVDVVSHVFAVRRSDFSCAGGFDEVIHYLGDESILQLRLARLGHESFVVPSAWAFHSKPVHHSLLERASSYNRWNHTAMLSEALLVQRRTLSASEFGLFVLVNTIRVALVECAYLFAAIARGDTRHALNRLGHASRTYLGILQRDTS